MVAATGEILTASQHETLRGLTAALAHRLVSMGEDASGLYRCYARKLDHKALLGECDLWVLQFLRERRGQFRRVWEIGPGVGQLTAMLALDGHDVVAFDRDQKRYAAMLSMLEVLHADAPDARARVETRLGSFPDALGRDDDLANDAILVLGCTFTADAACYRAFEEALGRFRFGVIDFARLFVETTNDDVWRQRASECGDRLNMSVQSCGRYRIPEEDKQGELFLLE